MESKRDHNIFYQPLGLRVRENKKGKPSPCFLAVTTPPNRGRHTSSIKSRATAMRPVAIYLAPRPSRRLHQLRCQRLHRLRRPLQLQLQHLRRLQRPRLHQLRLLPQRQAHVAKKIAIATTAEASLGNLETAITGVATANNLVSNRWLMWTSLLSHSHAQRDGNKWHKTKWVLPCCS